MPEPLTPREAREALIQEMIQITRRTNPKLAEADVRGVCQMLVGSMSDKEVFAKIDSEEE